MEKPLNHIALAQALRDIVRKVDLGGVRDSLLDGAPVRHHPSLDLAVIAFPEQGAPVWANVLFSREYPDGLIGEIPADGASLANVHFLADQTDAARNCIVWAPDSHWDQLNWTTLAGTGPHRHVAPYPASLLKVMVAVGVCRLLDTGRYDWSQPWVYGEQTQTIAAWCDAMIVTSNNDATSAMVALLHHAGLITRDASGEVHNGLNTLFSQLGLPTLQLNNTKADGGWRNGDGAGVGHLHMTAWDSARLLWLLLDTLPAAPWLPASTTAPLSPASRARFWGWMQDQALHEILSSTALAGVAGWQRGIPAQLPTRWIQSDGSVRADDYDFPADVRPENARATVRFAHKTGTTENYVSDAGWVEGKGGRRYLIALLTNLGTRYAPDAVCATDWRIPQIGAAVDTWLKQHLE
ncbi:serine hydrolase [Chitinimonas sp. BJYL2]|uniref:serine hydrolase n=1 Tax=Chitinimonas sp. BJYL2 TaxID=2976696 RepID=UPI0022B5C4C6|nr:serine hydrolase [Chitinimonas sp. BJYL2]